jgi:hypothetical protein
LVSLFLASLSVASSIRHLTHCWTKRQTFLEALSRIG